MQTDSELDSTLNRPINTALASIVPLLSVAINVRGSDVHLVDGAVPYVRVDGALTPVDVPALAEGQAWTLCAELLTLAGWDEFAIGRWRPELVPLTVRGPGLADAAGTDAATVREHAQTAVISVPELGRFRVRVSAGDGSIQVTLRRLPHTPMALDAIGLPEKVGTITGLHRGLVLIAGGPRSGKSTTYASLIHQLMNSRPLRTVSVEAVQEIPLQHGNGLVSQVALGRDVPSYRDGVDLALAMDADVIGLADCPDAATLREVLEAAAQRLVLLQVNGSRAHDAVDALISLAPGPEQKLIRARVANSIQMIIVQRLVPRADAMSQCVAVELALHSARVAECLAGKLPDENLMTVLSEGAFYGMQTFEQHLTALVRDRVVHWQAALAVADDPQELFLHFQRHGVAT